MAELRQKTKQLPEEDETAPAPGADAGVDTTAPADEPPLDEAPPGEADEIPFEGGEESPAEPYSAQVARYMHQAHSMFLENLHEMLQHLEHPDFKKLVERKLEKIDQDMTEIEEFFEKHHPDLPGLEGAMDEGEEGPVEEEAAEGEPEEENEAEAMGDEGEEAVAAGSGENEKPTEEEVVEGMETKNLRMKIKAKKKGGKKEGNWGARYNAALEELSEGAHPDDTTADERAQAAAIAHGGSNKKKAMAKKALCPECGKEDSECTCPGKTSEKIIPAVAAAAPAAAPAAAAPGLVEGLAIGSALSARDKKAINDGAGFLNELTTKQDFGEEDRMKSYHHWKVFDLLAGTISAAGDAALGEETKANPGTEEWLEEEKDEPEHHRTIKAAAGFFQELSRTRDFGDTHREKAGYWHRALEPISKEDDDKEKEEDDMGMGYKPGEMDTKGNGIKSLRSTFEKQNSEIEALAKRLAGLVV